MAGLRRVRTVIDDLRASSRSGVDGATVTRLLGRVVLWVCVVMVVVRGVGTIVGGRTPVVVKSGDGARRVLASWPDDEARAFAVGFARTYLTYSRSPSEQRAQARLLAGLMATGLSDQTTVIVPSRGSGTKVADATVAREVDLGDSRALITVAVFTNNDGTRYLSVPVERDRSGALVVFDAPSFSAPPPRATVPSAEPTPLGGPSAQAISDLVGRFLTAYLGGQPASALGYLTAPGRTVAPMPGGLELRSVDQLDAAPVVGGGVRVVVAEVTVRDTRTRALFAQRFRVSVAASGGRWLVAGVAGGPSA